MVAGSSRTSTKERQERNRRKQHKHNITLFRMWSRRGYPEVPSNWVSELNK